jgi:integrase
LRLGSLGKEGDLAFPGHAGQPMGPRTVPGGSFERPLGRAELPEKARPHDLGRTRATPLLGKGVHPEIVQERLGHATISITLGTYSHVLPGMGDQVANVIDEAP